jgi:predicted pyridoxine 5'-phosphate oxidase superfamily flavin-nucleotide-binding protein
VIRKAEAVTHVYHPGELAVQRLAGVSGPAARVGGIIRPAMPAVAMDFLRGQRLAVLGSVAPDGKVWASLLTGPAGFMRALDERTVRVEASSPPAGGDPLLENLTHRRDVGMLAIEFSTRQRMRLNGKAEVRDGALIFVRAEQVYSNCPRFIHEREVVTPDFKGAAHPSARRSPRLTDDHRRLIARADTFFVATLHPEGGADASHRGGEAGFVRVAEDGTILWPDYPGNHMFNTLGNIHSYPPAGLLFINFDEGHALQLSGRARVIWDARRAVAFEGAARLVEFRVEEVIETLHATPLRWRVLDPRTSILSGQSCAA